MLRIKSYLRNERTQSPLPTKKGSETGDCSGHTAAPALPQVCRRSHAWLLSREVRGSTLLGADYLVAGYWTNGSRALESGRQRPDSTAVRGAGAKAERLRGQRTCHSSRVGSRGPEG